MLRIHFFFYLWAHKIDFWSCFRRLFTKRSTLSVMICWLWRSSYEAIELQEKDKKLNVCFSTKILFKFILIIPFEIKQNKFPSTRIVHSHKSLKANRRREKNVEEFNANDFQSRLEIETATMWEVKRIPVRFPTASQSDELENLADEHKFSFNKIAVIAVMFTLHLILLCLTLCINTQQ